VQGFGAAVPPIVHPRTPHVNEKAPGTLARREEFPEKRETLPALSSHCD
jgi:hypothetical protein